MNSFIRSGISDFTHLLCFIILPLIGMSQVPYPPDSVYAEILGPDSALYVSWQTSDSTVIDPAAFNVYRLSDFDPEGVPSSGTQTFLLSQNSLFCFDPEWPDLSPGWYAYGIEAVYNNGMVSEMAVSNIVGHDLFCSLNITVSLETGEPAGMIHAELSGRDYPYEKYFSKDSAMVLFDSVLRGHYLVGAYHTGFDTSYLQNVLIYSDTMVNLLLGQRKRPVYDLEVDSVSLIATWSPPSLVALYEDFESGPFPPAGWETYSADDWEGWFRTSDGSSAGFAIPPGDGYYACSNDDMWGMAGTAMSAHDGCCDYLITPPLDLTESPYYQLDFSTYYTGALGQLAYVEYSSDYGVTWEVLTQLTISNIWHDIHTSLEDFSGENAGNPLYIAFHADDNGMWASGWAVDNVKIHVPGSQVEFTDFNVFLDDSLITNTTGSSWNYAPLNYGQHYTASVSVNYPYGISKKDYYSFTSRYLPPPRDFSAQDYEEDVVLQWYPPDDSLNRSGHENEAVPENLLGYNLYKNDSLLTYLAHSSANELQLYIDSDNYPGFYNYEISGVYDLEAYGFPGDTGESMRIGPVEVTIDYCTGMDFHEDWGSGTFYTNQWQTNPDEWRINEGLGNPAPSAEFMPDTILTNYSAPLLSYPLCGNLLSEGQIWLDFDLKLISNNHTGYEKLKVQVWNWNLYNWTTKKEYSNASGNISWTREHCYINAYAMNDIFRVRFVAEGVNSSDIEKWCLDNIDIRRFCPEPDSLYIEVSPDESSISLHWAPPEPYYIDTLLFWGDGESSGNSLGTGAAAEFDVAQRWDPEHLQDLSGGYITEVSFYPMELSCDYEIRIWTGPGAQNLELSQPYDPVIGQWNVVMLDDPFFIYSDEEIWIGYHVNAATGYPAGVDHGPAINGYGNMMNWGGWQTLLDINPDLNYNWCIKANVRTIAKKIVTLSANGIINFGSGQSRDIWGYNIYRKLGLEGEYELIDFIAEEPCIFTDLINELYCFKVTAVWSGEFDECESDYSNEACALISVGLDDPEVIKTEINLHPNPAKNLVMINSFEIIKTITVYDISGKIFSEISSGENNISFDTTAFPDGIYLVRIETGSKISFHKLVLNH